MTDVSDACLMDRVRSGDRSAFSQLVDRHKDRMVNYLTRLTGCRDRAEDVAQDTFIRLHASANRYREAGRFSGYLYRIATNLVRQEERRRKRWRLIMPLLAPTDSHGSNGHHPAPEAQANLLRREIHEQLSRAVASLPLRFRVPVVLRDIEGWSYADIARLTGWREGTVKSRLSRARRQLRTELAPYWNGDGQHG